MEVKEMPEIRQMLLTYGRGGRPGTRLSLVKGIVIHWTANTGKGANAVANRNYFENHPENKVSAHYIVDDHQVVQCIPDTEIAYHAGARQYRGEALRRLGDYPNASTVGIEMCVNSDGDFNKTYANTVELAASLLKKHNLTTNDLWRHYDITGKDCPRFFVNDATAKQYGFASAQAGWQKFKADVERVLKGGNTVAQEEVKKIVGYEAVKVIVAGKETTGYNICGSVYAPLRFVGEALGREVIWDGIGKVAVVK